MQQYSLTYYILDTVLGVLLALSWSTFTPPPWSKPYYNLLFTEEGAEA